MVGGHKGVLWRGRVTCQKFTTGYAESKLWRHHGNDDLFTELPYRELYTFMVQMTSGGYINYLTHKGEEELTIVTRTFYC